MTASARIVLLVALGTTACGPAGATQEQLLSRATFDLECPAPSVQVQDLGDRQRGVAGCGRRLSYVEVCEQRVDGNHCAWVINAAPWAYGPPMNKRPPTPPGTWFYSTPRPSPPSRPQIGPQRSEPFPQGTAPPPISPPAPVPRPVRPAPAPPEPFPQGTAPPPIPPPPGTGASTVPQPTRNPPLL